MIDRHDAQIFGRAEDVAKEMKLERERRLAEQNRETKPAVLARLEQRRTSLVSCICGEAAAIATATNNRNLIDDCRTVTAQGLAFEQLAHERSLLDVDLCEAFLQLHQAKMAVVRGVFRDHADVEFIPGYRKAFELLEAEIAEAKKGME